MLHYLLEVEEKRIHNGITYYEQLHKKEKILALAGWLSWLEHHPVYQKTVDLIPGLGTYLGCGFDPHLGCIW